jgi:hypothetical protein
MYPVRHNEPSIFTSTGVGVRIAHLLVGSTRYFTAKQNVGRVKSSSYSQLVALIAIDCLEIAGQRERGILHRILLHHIPEYSTS